jgi:capsular exopolysaccharide synthesis family protein
MSAARNTGRLGTELLPKSAASASTTELVMVGDSSGGRAEAIRGLRTHIMAQHVQLGRRSLAVCAPVIDSGCTFVAANLAIAFAQVGLKTLLINGDLRGPGIGTMIVPSFVDRGLRQCLTAPELDIVGNIEAAVLPNLSVLHSGGRADNALELLGDERFETLNAACMRDFDLTIIDTPPANVAADAMRIGAVAGYAMIVGRRNRTFVKDIKTLQAEMAADGVRVIGSALVEG